MDSITGFLIRLVVLAPPILMALTIHEVSHGLVAWRLGDPTAKAAGRLTLNPLKHLDPMGTLVFFITAWLGKGFGWAKPVPVNPRYFKDPRHGMIWVSLAGPAVNLAGSLVLAQVLGWLIHSGFFASSMLGLGYYPLWKQMLGQMLIVGVQINAILAFFNLLPLPPLDGSGILGGLLPPRAAQRYLELSRWGFVVLLAFIMLPDFLPGFPDFIDLLVMRPAQVYLNWILPL